MGMQIEGGILFTLFNIAEGAHELFYWYNSSGTSE